ncbi:MAG: NAD-glutamate dehydrogenase [Alphaproteobacteria bacterium]
MARSSTKKSVPQKPAGDSRLRQKFFEIFEARIADEDHKNRDHNFFTDLIERQWQLTKNKKPGESKIDVCCPPSRSFLHKKTYINCINDDMAFLVDSVAAEINRNNFLIEMLLHPLIYVRYDANGKLQDVSSGQKDGYKLQSHIYVQINRTLSDSAQVDLKKSLEESISDVKIANRDWRLMLAEMQKTRSELAKSKTPHSKEELQRFTTFLDFLSNNNFTFLGGREYEFTEKNGELKSKTVEHKNLGILRGKAGAYISESEEGLPRSLQELRRDLPAVSVAKTNRLSRVHRAVPMDAIAVKLYDKNGKVTGEKLFLGLFTSVTYSRSVSDVPYLREKVEDVMNMSDFTSGSHDRKALRHILEKYPRDELFQVSTRELFKTCLNILRLQERQRIALFMRHDTFGRYISCIVYVPRDRFGTTIRRRIEQILEEELHGKCTNFFTQIDDSLFARVMYTIRISQKLPKKYNAFAIEAKLQEAGQTWSERLTGALYETLEDDQEITRFSVKYADAFSSGYAVRYRPKQAVFDIFKIESVIESDRLSLDLYRTEELDERQLRLKIYNPQKPLTLSDVMPILGDMGLRAVSELPFEVKPLGLDKTIWIQDFLLETAPGRPPVDLDIAKDEFEKAFEKIWYREAESDALNKLILSSAVGWREVSILRTYVRYMRQVRSPYGQDYIQNALTENQRIAHLLINFFMHRHNPARRKENDKLADGCLAAIEKELQGVASLDQDRILRTLTAITQATLRTNYFQTLPGGAPKSWLSIKLDSKNVPDLPEPKPFREVFVYSPRVEAIHLRGDKIARGGLRWSDRHEDYRTEVLGLMKAQMVKNSVIVPMGSKGGFVVKTPTRGRQEFQAEGIECYRIFIRGLLDITDNRKGRNIVPPGNVVRYDGDDPYLVVAADKGTATFSDIANALSIEYGFWLGDAFASGGSAGYDHKKMGITAKGAWESIKLHFRQLNHDIQKLPFYVAGVGDMGGDVFGNAMILSDQIKLIGAFNHMHIFCDPDPDTKGSFVERQRLFNNVMGWDQYNTSLLSKGGRIYLRSEKTLKLTPEIRKRFDLDKDNITPAELMRAILKARTDLLWFGGIGTYIKSSMETHADASDKANDPLRIDGGEIRARVVGEGANLGVTQRGRIEYAEKGGRINTDFLDNSAGVNTSDNEVNIKILLNEITRDKSNGMDIKSRNKLLESMTDEVAAHVLRNNYQQAQAISLAELQAAENLLLHGELIDELERTESLKREIEFLPDQKTIAARHKLGKGMTRPELCTLLSYAKIAFTHNLLSTNIPDNPDMQDWLIDYFPAALRKKYPEEIRKHRLAREIIATSMANSLINRMGPAFIKNIMNHTGATSDAIAKAYIIVRDVYNLREFWKAIESLDNKTPAQVQLKAMREIAQMVEHAVTWLVTRTGKAVDPSTMIKTYQSGIGTLHKNLMNVLPSDMKANVKQYADSNIHDGLPKGLAYDVAAMTEMESACDIIRLSQDYNCELLEVAQVYFSISHDFHFRWLRQRARFMKSDDPWQQEAISGLIERLYASQSGLTAKILEETGRKAEGKRTAAWVEKNKSKIRKIEPFLAELRNAGALSLSMLVVAEQHLRGLYGE